MQGMSSNAKHEASVMNVANATVVMHGMHTQKNATHTHTHTQTHTHTRLNRMAVEHNFGAQSEHHEAFMHHEILQSVPGALGCAT